MQPTTERPYLDLDTVWNGTGLWHSNTWNINIRNIQTGKEAILIHHCSYCKATPTRECYKKLHLAYCAAIVERNDMYAFCGERLAVFSPGCGVHGLKPHNQPYQDAHKSYLTAEMPETPEQYAIRELYEFVEKRGGTISKSASMLSDENPEDRVDFDPATHDWTEAFKKYQKYEKSPVRDRSPSGLEEPAPSNSTPTVKRVAESKLKPTKSLRAKRSPRAMERVERAERDEGTEAQQFEIARQIYFNINEQLLVVDIPNIKGGRAFPKLLEEFRRELSDYEP